jgi:hypothetical protein
MRICKAFKANTGCPAPPNTGKRKRQLAEDRLERRELHLETRQGESHFNFPKMHLLTHFRENVEKYAGIPMFSTELGETAHRQQIKEGYRASNKIDFTKQILCYYAPRHALGMRILNLQVLCRNRDVEAPDDKLQDILRPR